MLQNRSSSARSAHANIEASVTGHCSDSCSKSIECVSKKREFFVGQKEILTWNIVGNLELGSEILVQEDQREKGILTWHISVRKEEGKGIGLRIILSKRVNGRKGVK